MGHHHHQRRIALSTILACGLIGIIFASSSPLAPPRLVYTPDEATVVAAPVQTPMAIATTGLPLYLSTMKTIWRDVGVSSPADLDTATLQPPVRIYTMRVDALRAYQPGQTRIRDIIDGGLFYEVPVTFPDPRVGGLMHVAYFESRWQALGGSAQGGSYYTQLQHAVGQRSTPLTIVACPPINVRFVLLEYPDHDEVIIIGAGTTGLVPIDPYSVTQRATLPTYPADVAIPQIQGAYAEADRTWQFAWFVDTIRRTMTRLVSPE